ncbi:low complexity HA-like repeat protein [Brazilian marseillevirus]|uniref:low complexity HA-like repeat protein n=1 Tax=Brazilian marseillevirus TaxID=1813599 RepID=UPI000783DAFA|nr:low complexity HA-like repeat protein [Brazilian marseillevirus]AMQ10548.1 low complexity HA-like repeat protein [Brazilian marseillevirus]
MTTNFETRRDLTVTKNFVVPVVPSLASTNIATPGSIVFDSSSGNLNISNGDAWSASGLPAATPSVRGLVFGVTDSNVGETTSLGYLTNSAGFGSTFIGYASGNGAGGVNECTAVGHSSMSIAGIGPQCVAVGVNAGRAAGSQNISVGVNALNGATGSNNICFGLGAGQGMTGSGNIIYGASAGDGIVGNAVNNIVIGFQAGRTGTTASGNIVIGPNASPSLGTTTNCISIGSAATCGTSGTGRIALGTSASCTVDNEMTIAPTITQWRSLGLAAAAAANTLQINPATGIITQAASSRRFKQNIRDLEVDTEKLYDLSLKTYDYKSDGKTDHGLIAEEAFEVLPDIVTLDAEDEPHGIKHLTLTMLLLAELQNLRAQVRELL